jgi:hypothetical protein
MTRACDLLFAAVALLAAASATAANAVPADCAHVVSAYATEESAGVYTFDTTVASTETGEDKYADEWRVVTSEGNITILGLRELGHPHVDEQPFTRGLKGVAIPGNVASIVVEANDSVLGYCGDVVVLTRNADGTTWTSSPRTARTVPPATNSTKGSNSTTTGSNSTIIQPAEPDDSFARGGRDSLGAAVFAAMVIAAALNLC